MEGIQHVLVTGANGFIGKKLVQRLEKETNLKVYTFIRSRDGDITKERSLDSFLDYGISHVFHLAAVANVLKCWEETSSVMNVNLMGTQRVLEFCRKTKASITFTSSYLYGNPSIFPVSEKADLAPNNPYAVSKKLGEDLCQYYKELFDINYCTLRLFNIYGPEQTTDFVIPVIIEQVIEKQGTGMPVEVRMLKPKRDYVYLDDITDAFFKSMVYLSKGKAVETTFNIASGKSYSVKDVFIIIKELMGADIDIYSKNISRTNVIMDSQADISLANNQLGWYPKTSFKSGIRSMLEAYNVKNLI